MKKIDKIDCCEHCPLMKNGFAVLYCTHQGENIPLIGRKNIIPVWCPLPDDTALSESEQQHLEASMKQNKALMQELAGK